jgi:hypothetical protein
MHRTIGQDGKAKDTVSIKGGVINGLEWKGAIHIFVRSAVVEIPAEAEQWQAEPDE